VDIKHLMRSGLGIPDYWHPHVELQSEFLSGKIARYPLSMDAKADYPGQLDDDGVPATFLDGRPYRLPVDITLYGLGSHDAFVATKNERYHQQLICTLRWLESHCVPLGEGIGWPNEDDKPVYGVKAPWFSAITQGLALSLFLRAHQLDSSGPWSRLAYQTWLGYRLPVEEGGFCRNVEGGCIYEEYPGPELDCVFNGMCFALIGLWEGSRSGLIAKAEADFRRGLTALRCYLPRFDHGGWSLYSLNRCLGKPLLASPYYHRANALLAEIIGLMGDEAEFLRNGERWLKTGQSLGRRIRISLRIGLDRYLYARSSLAQDLSKPPS
jgi:heparosan-N-sulfate-glucuronate 5-epimerase